MVGLWPDQSDNKVILDSVKQKIRQSFRKGKYFYLLEVVMKKSCSSNDVVRGCS